MALEPGRGGGGVGLPVQGRGERGGGDPEVWDGAGLVKVGRRGYVWEWWWEEGRWAG